DVGCGSGLLLDSMRAVGWEARGIELDAETARLAAARAKCEDHIFTGSVDEAEYPSGQFALVTASHVLEHVHNPLSALKRIRRWLHTDGQLRIWIPNLDSLESRMFRSRWSGLDIPRHLFHFSRQSITRMLNASDFTVIRSRPQFQGSSLGM